MKRNNRTKKNKKEKIALKRRYISLIILVVLLSSLFIPSFASTPNTLKEEVIYINLNMDGSVDSIYVVNSFDLTEDGQIIDYGDYTAFRQLTDSEKFEMENELIRIDAKAGRLYYEGKLKENSIPWIFDLKYFIDRKEYKGEETAGKSGKLEIVMEINENKEAINEFFKHLTLQVGFTLDASICKNISGEGATIVNAGKNKQILFTILPGKSSRISVNADVVDFEMEGISINAIPMNMDFDFEDDPQMTKQLNELRDGVIKLDDGAKELRGGSGELADGTKKLKDGVIDLNEGIDDLTQGAEELTDGTKELVDGVIELNDGVKDLADGTNDLTKGTREIDKGAKKLLAGAKDLHIGAKTLSEGLSLLSSQKNSLMGGAGQIFDYMLAAANDELSSLNMGIPFLTKDNFKIVLDNMLNQIGGNAIQTAMEQAEAAIRLAVTSAIREGIEAQYPEASNEVIDSIMNSEEIKSQIDQTVAVQIEEQREEILKAVEQEMASNPNYVALLTLREQLSGFAEFYSGLKAYTKGVSDIAGGAADLHSGIGEWKDGMIELRDGTLKLKNGAFDLNEGVIELEDGVAKLLDGTVELNEGVIEFKDGVIELKDGVIKLLDGAIELHDGTVELHDGAVTMAEGTFEFRDKTADIEKDFKDAIKEKIDEIFGRNFKVISFVSDKNTNVESVQFVMQTEGISIPDKIDNQIEEEAAPTFLERLKGLFGF